MRSFNFIFFLIFFVFSHKIISQELNAQVIVNSNLVNQTNQQIFETLEKSLNEFINNQAGTIDGTQTVENGVLAGPITVPGTITVTGTLVIV